MIEVLAAGSLSTVQDLGRPGLAHLGVPPSGAADAPSLRLGNRLVGNPEDAAALELTLMGPRLRFARDTVVALTGAAMNANDNHGTVAMNAPHHVAAGDTLTLGAAHNGLRTYLAVRGGIAAPPTLGSRAHDTLSALGPPPLRVGDRLPIGEPSADMPGVDLAPVAPLPSEPALRVVLGPREDWFIDDAIHTLLHATYRAGSASNRVGLRLEGPLLKRRVENELLSEGMITGALQVPPSGQPILLLNDHPTTGGYPVIAVVVAADLPLAAQVRPGGAMRFVLA